MYFYPKKVNGFTLIYGNDIRCCIGSIQVLKYTYSYSSYGQSKYKIYLYVWHHQPSIFSAYRIYMMTELRYKSFIKLTISPKCRLCKHFTSPRLLVEKSNVIKISVNSAIRQRIRLRVSFGYFARRFSFR